MTHYDLAIVGSGILGLAHALAAAREGLSVVVVDRDAQANGASIRNFGLVVVTGQDPGMSLRRAQRTRDIWLELASEAGFDVIHQGKLVVAQRPEAMALIEAFMAQGADGCRLLTVDEVMRRQPDLDASRIVGGLLSPHEVRVESREVLPRIASHLAERYGVDFRFGVAATKVSPPMLQTSEGDIRARKFIICPGDDLTTLFPERLHALRRCKLQMLRLAPPGFTLRHAIVSDLSLLRYEAYAKLPEALGLRRRLEREQRAALENGVHLIVVQSADGSLVVGDSHHYGRFFDPFGSEAVDRLILSEFALLFGRVPDIVARWTGSYTTAAHPALIDAPHEDVRLVMVTSGTGASTGFAIGEETIRQLFGPRNGAGISEEFIISSNK